MSFTHQNKQCFNDLKHLLEWIPEYSAWKLTWSCFVFLRISSIKYLLPKHSCFWDMSLLLHFTSMIRISSLPKIRLSFFGCKFYVPVRVFSWSNYWVFANKASKEVESNYFDPFRRVGGVYGSYLLIFDALNNAFNFCAAILPILFIWLLNFR